MKIFSINFLSEQTIKLILIQLYVSILLIASPASGVFFKKETFFFDVDMAIEHYPLTRDVVLAIWENYDPKFHIFIGIGRSPTPIIAFMQAASQDVVSINLPLKNIRGFKLGGVNRLERPQMFNAAAIERLDQHFDHFLPQDLQNKKIIVIDYADTGASLDIASQEIRRYYLQRQPNLNIEVIGLGIARDEFVTQELLRNHHHVLRAPVTFILSLILNRYKLLNEFEVFDLDKLNLNKSYERPKRRQNDINSLPGYHYDNLLLAYQRQIIKDRVGSRSLAKLVPLHLKISEALFKNSQGLLSRCNDWLRQRVK
jgi:hypothetical protein